MTHSYFAIIPAAGFGSRMQSSELKQYLKIAGKTILERSVETLAQCPEIKKIWIVLNSEDQLGKQLPFSNPEKIEFAVGGSTRIQSVFNALQKVREIAKNDDWVLVHDAARPGLTSEDLKRLITTIGNHPVGGILGIPVRDTLKRVNEVEIQKTLSRENLWGAQTPQQFRVGILWKALTDALKDAYVPTDDCEAVEKLGLKPMMILGGAHNLKITYPEDLKLFEKYEDF